MKRIKQISILCLVISLLVFGGFTTYHFLCIQSIKNEVQTYMNEKADIQIQLNGVNVLLNNTSKKEPQNFQKTFEEAIAFYEDLSKKEYLNHLKLYYEMNYLEVENEDFYITADVKDAKWVNENHLEIVDGRNFTEDEIKNGSNKVIIGQSFVYRYGYDDPLEVGDTIHLYEEFNYGIEQSFITEPISLEIIGIYKTNNIIKLTSPSSDISNYIYVPSQTILEISEAIFNQSNEEMGYYTRLRLYPIISCENEVEAKQVLEELDKYSINVPHGFSPTRLDKHQKSDYHFETKIKQHQDEMAKYGMVTIVLAILLILIMGIHSFNKKKEQKKFEEIILKEQEKNVQNVFMLNQDTHKLRHDLKHFFSQLMVYVENDDKEKVKELLKDYHDEIISLEIPAFTQNGVVDMILNHYISKAKKMKVDFTYSSTLVGNLKIKDRKLYILLSNALENAFIHSSEPKVVKMDMGCVGSYCRFTITNTYNHKQEDNQDENHGYGLISMRKIVDEVHGECTCNINNNTYVCTILIPIE